MKFIRILPLMIPIILTACAGNVTSESASAPESINASVPDSLPDIETAAPESDISETEPPAITDTDDGYIGVCGEVFEVENFEEKPDSDFLVYQTDYGYTALFDGKTYNSYDDPEKFDPDTWQCIESCEAASGGFFIINKGDNIGDLTCTDASAEYFINTTYPTHDDFGLIRSNVCFEGEVEVTGYIDRFDGNEGYVDEGEMFFYPDGESWQGLPVPYEARYYNTYSLKDERLIYAPFRISLGVIFDYSRLDLERDIPQGSTAHMRLVLKDIQFKYVNSNFGGYMISTATIVSAEKID